METKLTETQQKVLDNIEKFSDSSAEMLQTVTGVNKLQIYKVVKVLSKNDLITISETKPPTYSSKKPKFTDEKKVSTKSEKEVSSKTTGRDAKKFKFDGQENIGKGRLVLAVVRKWIENNDKATMSTLREAFPDELNKRYGVFQTIEKAKENSVDRDRYFMKPEDLIKVGNKKIAVCNQFGSHNLPLKHFKSLGFKIS